MIRRAIGLSLLLATVAEAQEAPDGGFPEIDGGQLLIEDQLRESKGRLADAGIVMVAGAFACEPVGDDPCGSVSDDKLGQGWWVSGERLQKIDEALVDCRNAIGVCQTVVAEQDKTNVSTGPVIVEVLGVGIVIGAVAGVGGVALWNKIFGAKK